MQRLLILTALLALLVAPSCGSGDASGATGTIVVGPAVMAIPALPVGIQQNVVLGLRNLTEEVAMVYVTAHRPDGTAYPAGTVPVTLPPGGGVWESIMTFTGGVPAAGWFEIDTRNPNVLDANGEPSWTSTTGFVAAYVHRIEGGEESDATLAMAFRDDFAFVNITEGTFSYQVINHSYVPAGGGSTPAAITATVNTYDAYGLLTSSLPVNIDAGGTFASLAPVTFTGRVEVVPATGPAGAMYRIAISTQELNSRTMAEGRFLYVPRDLPRREGAFDLEFGWDQFGNPYDFGVVLTNPTDSREDVQIHPIHRSDGAAITVDPIIVGVNAKSTKYLATTTDNSEGLEAGEVSPFELIFPSIGGFPPVTEFTMHLSAPVGMAISAREFPALFTTWYRILPGRKGTTDAIVLGVDVPTDVGLGVRNFISLMNPTARPRSVHIRGYTPGGTVYILGPLTLSGYQRLDWSPDGTIWREEPTDTTGPAVRFMAFRFSSDGGIFINGRRVRYSPVTTEIVSMRPHAWRDLRAE